MPRIESVSVVVPVYRGESSIRGLVEEVLALNEPDSSVARDRAFHVVEVILVWDSAVDGSDVVLRELEHEHEEVRAVWLTRNFGQHAATLAGMASSTADWVVTMDEDGLHDPRCIETLLNTALAKRADVVYAHAFQGTSEPGAFRRFTSTTSRFLSRRYFAEDSLGDYSSFRLVRGDIARAVSAYAGSGAYLDVAISWLTTRWEVCRVAFRPTHRVSTYSGRTLAAHFRRLVVTSGVRPLRLVFFAGLLAALTGVVLALYISARYFAGDIPIEGWSSVMVAVLLLGGAMLLALGVVAEYLAVAVQAALGRPMFLISRDPRNYFTDTSDTYVNESTDPATDHGSAP